MSHRRQQQDAFRCIAFRLGPLSFAVDAAIVVSAHEAGYVGPVLPDSPQGATGTLMYGQDLLPVFNLASCLGIPDAATQEREHSVIVRSRHGLVVLQVRDVSRVLMLTPEQRVPLPAPLDKLVGDRYASVLKWASTARQLTADDLALGVRGEQHRTELMLQLNPDVFLSGGLFTSREALRQPSSPSSVRPLPKSAESSTTKLRLLTFAPTLATLENRPCLFGISAAQVLEVCRPLPLIPVPGAEEYVQGIVEWRSSVVPVLRMAKMIGMDGLPEDRTQRLLIARTPDGGHLVGVHVTSSIRTQALTTPRAPRSFSLATGAGYAYGAFELEQESLVMPNLSRMLHLA